jgi:hypothetical protein
MRTAVITSFSRAGHQEYGDRFIRTFQTNWPVAVELIVYRESPFSPSLRAEQRDLFKIEACNRFIAANGSDAEARGLVPTAIWKAKERTDGYSYRFDALKFCRKVFAIADAARQMQTGLLAWIDADAYTHEPVPEDFIEEMLDGQDAAYLGRDRTHTECGFLAFRLPEALPLIEAWEAFYATDSVFDQREWHDSYLFDRARESVPGNWRNMTPGGSRHVWFSSPLAPFMDHLKGDRKKLGISPERQRAI